MIPRNRPHLHSIVIALVLVGVGFTKVPAQSGPVAPSKDQPKPTVEASKEIEIQVQWQGKPAAGIRVWIEETKLGLKKEENLHIVGPQTTPASGKVRLSVDSGASQWSVYAQDEKGHLGVLTLGNPRRRFGNDQRESDPGDQRIAIDLLEQQDLSGILTYKNRPFSYAHVKILLFMNVLDRNKYKYASPHTNFSSSVKAIAQMQKTDAEGKFTIEGFPDKTSALIEIQKEGLGSGIVRIEPGVVNEVEVRLGGSLAVSIEDEEQPRTLKSVEWKRIADETGKPPQRGPREQPKKIVYLRPEKTSHLLPDWTVPGVMGVEPGTYRYSIPVDPDHAEQFGTAGDILIESGKTTKLVLKKALVSSISGRILDAKTGKGIPYFEIQLKGTQQWKEGMSQGNQLYTETHFTTTDKEGNYSVACKGDHMYTIQFGKHSYNQRNLTDYEYPYWDTQLKKLIPDVPFAKLEKLDRYQFPDISLQPLRVVTCLVKNDDGKPVEAPYEVFRPATGLEDSDPPAVANGTFTLSRIHESHPFKVFVRKGTAVNDPKFPSLGKQDEPLNITISEKNQVSCKGKIVDEKGQPVARAQVSLIWKFDIVALSNSGNPAGFVKLLQKTLVTNELGQFEANGLWPGENYYIEVKAPGFESWAPPDFGVNAGQSANRQETIDFGSTEIRRAKASK